ncbi:olfactomedin-4-like [Pyxicephalus adspersus]|uniref:olfactomedin-4-like n=1 Tax=Pyxicephalus adspersus TaxID=30357 RepID=UPI003B5C7693
MYTIFFLLLGVWKVQTDNSTQTLHSESGHLDGNGVCYCNVNLPDTTFPADRFERLEMANHNLTTTVNKEISKIINYVDKLTTYVEQLKNLTKRVEIMESGGLSYTELDFELIKLEIQEMETLILQLKTTFNDSNAVIETLYEEIHNISIMVNQLEVYDKNNVLVIRREIVALKKRLEECERNNTKSYNPSLPQPAYGTCEHGEITNVSKPFVVQLNWAGFNSKWGGWGSDSYLGANQSARWVAILKSDSRMMNSMRFYPSYNDMLLYKSYVQKDLEKYLYNGNYDYTNNGQGSGMILYDGFLYYNCYNSRDLCKYNTKTYVVDPRRTLGDAVFNNRFPYASSGWHDIDFAGDEEGLWVIYATESNSGNMVISKLNATSLEVLQTWQTNQYKTAVTNAFMACGVLYATRALSTQKEEIFYMYNTKTGKEGKLSVQFAKMPENIQSLSYNPNNHKLYVFNDGYQVSYDVTFDLLQDNESKK